MVLSFGGRAKLSASTVFLLALLLLGSVGLVGLGLRQFFRLGKPITYKLKMLIDPVPTRQLLARKLAAEAKKRGLDIEIVSKPHPSLEVLKLIDAHKEFDVALVPGGVGGPSEYPRIRQAASLGTDPLHVFVRGELFESASKGLAVLRGKRINCGPPNSVLRVLNHDVLRFAGLRVPTRSYRGDFIDVQMTSQELLTQLERIDKLSGDERAKAMAALPDAVLFLTPMPSILGRKLVSVADFRLVPLPFTEAYSLDRLNVERELDDDDDGDNVDRASIVETSIPQNLYGTDPPVPPERCKTLGTRLLLIAGARVDSESVARLLETVYHSSASVLIQPTPIADQIPQFELHPGAELYVKRRQPFFTPDFMAQAGKLMGGLGALASGLVGVYGFLRILQLRRFEAYYNEVRRIALVARGIEKDAEAPTEPAARRRFLLDKLDDLKSEAVRDFADGGLKGEGLLAGIVALVNDTRASLMGHDRMSREETLI